LGGHDSLLEFFSTFLIAELVFDIFNAWYYRNFFCETQNSFALVCFFSFFRAHLLSVIELVRWVDWLAGRRATLF
jgi:hypothetical protein